MTKKRQQCYTGIFNKIDSIETRILEIKEQLASLKEGYLNDDNVEECVDEIEAEKALLEIMNEAAIGALLDTEPQGDA
jgi:predicted component of type VI protein secretion system